MKSEVGIEFDTLAGQVSEKELHGHWEQSVSFPGLTIFSHRHQNPPLGSGKLVEWETGFFFSLFIFPRGLISVF